MGEEQVVYNVVFDIKGKEQRCNLVSIFDDQLGPEQDNHITLTRQAKNNSIILTDYTFGQATEFALEAENAMQEVQ